MNKELAVWAVTFAFPEWEKQLKEHRFLKMIFQLVRRLHTNAVYRAAESSLLAKLRKKTGYTIANCKKALEMHNNDTDKAEAWLNEQAQAMGWAKATKLAGRTAVQGLIAVKFDRDHGALVELNCETDFVAKNDKFHKMIEDTTNACFKFAHTSLQSKGPITKMELDSEQLGNLSAEGGKKLSEVLALFIGTVGENAVLRRAECWKANNQDVKIAGYTHPAPAAASSYSAGKYGALIAYTQKSGDDIGRQICQHIVGCAPNKIGHKDNDKPATNTDDETCLIFQEYLLDPSYNVNDVLQQHQAEVIDFVRFSCGEAAEASMPGVEKQPLDSVQTLQ